MKTSPKDFFDHFFFGCNIAETFIPCCRGKNVLYISYFHFYDTTGCFVHYSSIAAKEL